MPSLVRKNMVNGSVYMSSVSDPYQPIERKLELTRNILKNMDRRIKLSILTKSNLVLRDIDLLKEFKNIEVGITINSFKNDVKRKIEPFSPSNDKRIDTLKTLYENGIKNYAFISPIIPDLTDIEQLIKETKNFTDFYWLEFLNIKASGREFREWLKQNYLKIYEAISNKDRVSKYLKETINVIKRHNVSVKGICIHYPKLTVIRIDQIPQKSSSSQMA